LAPGHLAKQKRPGFSNNLGHQEPNYAPFTTTMGLLGRSRRPKSNLTHHFGILGLTLGRFARKIRPRRSRNATQAPPTRFRSAFSLILGLVFFENNEEKSFEFGYVWADFGVEWSSTGVRLCALGGRVDRRLSSCRARLHIADRAIGRRAKWRTLSREREAARTARAGFVLLKTNDQRPPAARCRSGR
jgi:hypothetical protein